MKNSLNLLSSCAPRGQRRPADAHSTAAARLRACPARRSAVCCVSQRARGAPSAACAHRVERAHKGALLLRQLAYMLGLRARAAWRAISGAVCCQSGRGTRVRRRKARSRRAGGRVRQNASPQARGILPESDATGCGVPRGEQRARTDGGVWQLLQELLQLLVAQKLRAHGRRRQPPTGPWNNSGARRACAAGRADEQPARRRVPACVSPRQAARALRSCVALPASTTAATHLVAKLGLRLLDDADELLACGSTRRERPRRGQAAAYVAGAGNAARMVHICAHRTSFVTACGACAPPEAALSKARRRVKRARCGQGRGGRQVLPIVSFAPLPGALRGAARAAHACSASHDDTNACCAACHADVVAAAPPTAAAAAAHARAAWPGQSPGLGDRARDALPPAGARRVALHCAAPRAAPCAAPRPSGA
jgi:hypothetical protein